MKSQICDLLGIEFPMVAFSHCRDVVAAVSKAGGMGVLGAVGLSPEKLEIELNWIDEIITLRISRCLINKFSSLSYKNFTLFL